jgi:hypothetical protein
VKERLHDFGANHNIVEESDRSPLVVDLVRRFEGWLSDCLEDVIRHLLERLVENLRCLGDEACGFVLNGLRVEVQREFCDISRAHEIDVVCGIADVASQFEDRIVLMNLCKFKILRMRVIGPLKF